MRQFLKQIFASLIGSLAGLSLFCGLGTIGLIILIIAAGTQDSTPQVKDKSVLIFDSSLNITDTDPTSSTGDAIGQALSGEESNTITLRTVLNSLEEATQDPRIIALYIDGSHSGGGSTTGLATLKEVRAAMEKFRAAGKTIIAYDVDLSEREYYLNSVADTLILNPMGGIEINGFSSEPLFLTGALEKFGVGVQVIRVGKYKSAVEPFLLKELSPENRQQLQALLGDIWGELIATVGKSRKISPQQLQGIADSQGVLMASDAKTRGLIDKVAYFDEVITDLKKIAGATEDEKSFPQIRLSTYAEVAMKEGNNKSSKNKIAVIYANGEIVDGEGGPQQVGGDSFAKQMRQLRLDNDVKAVVLRVNSPGGSATASEIIQREVRLTRAKKPVIVSMGDMAASGGYWISTYGNRIFAEPNTVTGSIGVFGMLLNFQKLANDNGLTWDVVKTGNLADSQTVSRPKTPQEIAIAQNIVNQIYNQFLDKVADSRKIPKPKVAQIAQGRVWSGSDAKQLGLVDEIGGLDEAIAYAAKQADLGDNWQLEEYPKFRSLEERILLKLTGDKNSRSQKISDPLTREFLKLKADLEILQGLNDPKGVYARLPFNWRID
ncbi:MAG TPA: signal peptide peptidase SppA [Cyanobacteria bacterium UBA11149]|nr:signal peptide peptidase SppA [Cyanobacteria bacterium UBA11367]HBE59718.1 signal peptide peptidase SppA [Cyanobacteria bacterium UBA11366]HBK62905.1 signal peptide peptidase SppA [Cyanobacteria bacterium UBA11166]HBR76074.1 signal peptide peptidase SppA [Cyanobacteria bacterium UBA11159]HBS72346.1 signal peptide peptidase SppA [Cyanobacteria bacterium UBA11153]HBW92325.1 signal peptide peptidase SppA [Cyanobacteria bacterium UBA11149]HCA96156.1 signal peptide peptidase SppA [Cyanobacteria